MKKMRLPIATVRFGTSPESLEVRPVMFRIFGHVSSDCRTARPAAVWKPFASWRWSGICAVSAGDNDLGQDLRALNVAPIVVGAVL